MFSNGSSNEVICKFQMAQFKQEVSTYKKDLSERYRILTHSLVLVFTTVASPNGSSSARFFEKEVFTMGCIDVQEGNIAYGTCTKYTDGCSINISNTESEFPLIGNKYLYS